MNQQTRPHHVTQKLIPQSVAFVSAFDETGNIRNDKTFSFAITDHAQVRHQRREGIVGNLRSHRGDRRDQCRFAGIGQADDADVGQQPELDLKFPFLSRFAGLGISAGF